MATSHQQSYNPQSRPQPFVTPSLTYNSPHQQQRQQPQMDMLQATPATLPAGSSQLRHSRTTSFFNSLRPNKLNSANTQDNGTSNDHTPPQLSSIDEFGASPRAPPQQQQQQPPKQNLSPTTAGTLRRQQGQSQPTGIANPAVPAQPLAAGQPLHAEVRSVVQLQLAHAHKVYFSGPLIKRTERLPDGQRPHKDEGWVDVWAQLGGTTLSVWDMQAINEASKRGDEVPPSYINVTDAFIQVLGSVTIPSSPTVPSRKYMNVITLNTAGANLILFSCPDTTSLISWAAALRLCGWEKSRLEEIYSAHILRLSFNDQGSWREPPSTLINNRLEGPGKIRVAGKTDWKPIWMVVQAAVGSSASEDGRPLSPQSQMGTKSKKRVSALFARTTSTNDVQQQQQAASMTVFASSKPKDRKKPLLTIKNVSQAFAVYPERPELINASTLIKVEGSIGDEEMAGSMKNREGFMFFMPEIEPGKLGSRELLKWMTGIHDAFRMYGRPEGYTWDPRNGISLMFAYPVGPAKEKLFLDRELAEPLDPRDDRTSAIRSRFTQICTDRMRLGPPNSPPNSPPGRAPSARVPVPAVTNQFDDNSATASPDLDLDGADYLASGPEGPPQSAGLPHLPILPPLDFRSQDQRTASPQNGMSPVTTSNGTVQRSFADTRPLTQRGQTTLPSITERSTLDSTTSGSFGSVTATPLDENKPRPRTRDSSGVLPPTIESVPSTRGNVPDAIQTSPRDILNPPVAENRHQDGTLIIGRNFSNSPVSDSEAPLPSPRSIPVDADHPGNHNYPGFSTGGSPRFQTRQSFASGRSSQDGRIEKIPQISSPGSSSPAQENASVNVSPTSAAVSPRFSGGNQIARTQSPARSAVIAHNSPPPPQKAAPIGSLPATPSDLEYNNRPLSGVSKADSSPRQAISPLRSPNAETTSPLSTQSARNYKRISSPTGDSEDDEYHDGQSYQPMAAVGAIGTREPTKADVAAVKPHHIVTSRQPSQTNHSHVADQVDGTPSAKFSSAHGNISTPNREDLYLEEPHNVPLSAISPSPRKRTGTPMVFDSQNPQEAGEFGFKNPDAQLPSPIGSQNNSLNKSNPVNAERFKSGLGRKPSGARAAPTKRNLTSDSGSTAMSTTHEQAAPTFDSADALVALSFLQQDDQNDADVAPVSPVVRSRLPTQATTNTMQNQAGPSSRFGIDEVEENPMNDDADKAPYRSSFAPSKHAAERKATRQAAQAATHTAISQPGRPNGGVGMKVKKDRGAWESSEDEEDEEEDDEDDSDHDKANKVDPMAGPSSRSAMYSGVAGGSSSDVRAHQRPPRSLPALPMARTGSGDLQGNGMLSNNGYENETPSPPRTMHRESDYRARQTQPPPPDRHQSEYLQPPAQSKSMWSTVLDGNRNPQSQLPSRDTFVNLDQETQSMTKAFTPQGLLSAGLQDKEDRSAKRQEEMARESGASLINVPSKPPPPQTGLLGAITGYERDRKRDGGVGAALTERERDRRLAEDRQRKLDDLQKQQLDQQQQMAQAGGAYSMYGGQSQLSPYGHPMMGNPMMGGGSPMMGGGSPMMNPMMGGGYGFPQMMGGYPNPQHMFAAQQAAAQAYHQAMMSFSQAGSQVGGDDNEPTPPPGGHAMSPPPNMSPGMGMGMGMMSPNPAGYDPRMSMMSMGMGGWGEPRMNMNMYSPAPVDYGGPNMQQNMQQPGSPYYHHQGARSSSFEPPYAAPQRLNTPPSRGSGNPSPKPNSNRG